MKYYMAPLEGVTGYVYRNAYDRNFKSFDKYFTPFIPPNENRCMNAKERNDILPDHNEGLNVVPQILTNNASHFISTAKELKEFGYDEINLNLGCPSGTVTAKGKGAGFLGQLDKLEEFLDTIYDALDMKISIKTRMGMEDVSEFEDIMRLYEKFPISELIVHPRLRTDFYKGHVHLDEYISSCENWKTDLCYNGDIVDVQFYQRIMNEISDTPTTAVMLGRGLIANPLLLEEVLEAQNGLAHLQDLEEETENYQGAVSSGKVNLCSSEDICRIMRFIREVEAGYVEIISGDRNVLFRLKELWGFLGNSFPGCEKQMKKIRKANRLVDYHSVLKELESSML